MSPEEREVLDAAKREEALALDTLRTPNAAKLRCPSCGEFVSRVVKSRARGDAVKRRRQCETCGARFTTTERIDRAA